METSIISRSSTTEKRPSIIKTKRAAIYIRCSSDEAKKEGYSPETQKEKTKRFIEDSGWQLNENYIYSDIGFSGGTEKRPDLQKLLLDAKNKEFDVIVVYRMDRFFRNLRLLLNTVGELRELGIEFKSVTEPFDTSTPTGRAMFANAGIFAEWMREVGLESRNEGMVKAMKEGKYLSGTPPYGYDRNEKTQGLKRNKDEIAVIKIIFAWLVNDRLSEYKIQQKINALKIPTKYDNLNRNKKTGSKCWWNRRTIGRILRNEVYATGIYYYRKHKYLGRVRGKNNLRPKEEWIRVEDKSLKVIPQPLFEKAQQQLKKNKELSSRNTKQIYALQHKMICGYDGYRYQCATRHYSNRAGHSETKYYFCCGIRTYFTPKHCSTPSISESRVLPPVWDKFKEILAHPEKMIQELKLYLNRGKDEKHTQEQLKRIQKAVNSANTKRERYAELYAEGSINKDFYEKKVLECEKETEELQKEEERLSQLLLTEEEKEKRIESIKELHNQLKEELKNATYEVKREFLQCLVEKIIKTDDRLDIEFRLPSTINVRDFIPVVCSDSRRMD